MKTPSLILPGIGLSLMVHAQSPEAVIDRVFKAQQNIQSAAYHVVRQDTLVTGDTRTLSGDILVSGGRFCVHQDGRTNIRVFDGQRGYDLDTVTHQYESFEKLPAGFLYNNGTQLIVKDFLQLDTSKAIRTALVNTGGRYELTFYYADLTAYDVMRRRKTVTINPNTWLPIAVREHQETFGRVQDLYYQVSDLRMNIPFNISLSNYALQTKSAPMIPVSAAVPATAFPFMLNSFSGDKVSLSAAKGKIVLIDFWEVWCGPCIESLPKVEALYQEFHADGLEVYGITHDSAQLAPARKLVAKFRISFPVLIGTAETKINYKIDALPTYLLIDREGRIIKSTAGFDTALEDKIKELLVK